MTPTWRSRLGRQIAAYLALKKSLGRRFLSETYLFIQFDRSSPGDALQRSRPPFSPNGSTPSTTSPRRCGGHGCGTFAIFASTFVAPTGPASCRIRAGSDSHVARRPHIFSVEEIERLLHAATVLPARSTSLLRGPVFRLAVVLLYTAGLRRGELVRLTMSDYDPVDRTLLVRTSKFHKSRLVALSKSAVGELERYLRLRRRLPSNPDAHSS